MLGAIITNVKDVIVLVLMFSFTIFIHELGHFLVALKCGMVIDTFSIGFGPALWKRKVKGITYKIGVIPFGGYVALPQLDPTGMATVQGGEEGKDGKDGKESDPPERDLPEIAPWKKMLVSLAGAVGNVILAIVLAWWVFLSPRAQTGAPRPYVGFVSTNSVAQEAGLQAGDHVTAVNGKPIETWYSLMEECILQADRKNGNQVTLTLDRGGESLELAVPVVTVLLSATAIDGLGEATPCMFVDVPKGAEADAAGVKPGDRLVALEGQRGVSLSHFLLVTDGRDGETVTVTVARGKGEDESRHDARLTLPIEGLQVGEPAIIGAVGKESPAAGVGLRANDIVRSYNGVPIVCWRQFAGLVRDGGGAEAMITVERGEETFTASVKPEFDKEYGKYRLGVRPGIELSPPWMRFKRPSSQLKGDASGIKRILGGLLNPKEVRNVGGALGGPVAIFRMLWQSIKANFMIAVGFLRFLNINLAILNLLPIPVLDGGHIVFSTWELVSRRKAHPKLVNALVNLFAILLIFAFVLLTAKDVGLTRLVKRIWPGGDKAPAAAVTNGVESSEGGIHEPEESSKPEIPESE